MERKPYGTKVTPVTRLFDKAVMMFVRSGDCPACGSISQVCNALRSWAEKSDRVDCNFLADASNKAIAPSLRRCGFKADVVAYDSGDRIGLIHRPDLGVEV